MTDLSIQAFDALEDRLTAPVSERMLDLAGLSAGMRVLDLASGRGEPALRAAGRVGERGRVLGVDLSEAALAAAAEKARRLGLANVDLRVLDAAEADTVAHGFDVVTARWGLMYMRAPGQVLRAARRALHADGRLVAALWAEPERIPWWSLPRRVTARHVPFPPVDPAAPGPSRYADLACFERDLDAAGFAVTHAEEHDVPVVEADTSAGIAAWIRAVLGTWVRDLPAERAAAWGADLARELEAHRVGPTFRLGGVTRLVVARAVGGG